MVGGFLRASSDPDTVNQFRKNELVLRDRGVWYEEPGSSGTRELKLYPTPTGSSTLEVEWVYRPAALAADEDEPSAFPEEFHHALLYEAGAVYYETVEDNPDLAQRNAEKADAEVAEMQRYDNERRSGSGVFRIGIKGVTA